MYKNKKFLAIIPARSGSEGIKDKNIKELNGKPMIAYTIEAAIKSYIFDDIVVSTDSEKYAQISRKYGARVPFLRPDNLATDDASSKDVIEHVLKRLLKEGKKFDYFALLQPTSPLRNKNDIIEAVDLLFLKNANAVISVCETDHSPLWTNTLCENLQIDNFIKKEVRNSRRQDLPKYYRLNGAIYIAQTDYFLKYKDWFKEKSYAYIMPKERSIDVDNILDFRLAEIILQNSY
ncbi:MAG: CMP-N,N-diacetyllegionaminic acid synthase [Thermosediminibacterales bacterium]|jgi:CMP-N-acetylneuraminic acid synthetase|nr:CMP-N,N-diacetyllegionaminic acid synthase [Thermosediminibacterales bacterium]